MKWPIRIAVVVGVSWGLAQASLDLPSPGVDLPRSETLGVLAASADSVTSVTRTTSGTRRSLATHTLVPVVVPEPSTYIAGALLGIPLLFGGLRSVYRRNRSRRG